MFPQDLLVIDDVIKKPVLETKKPVEFFKTMLQDCTLRGEWILNGVGKCQVLHIIIQNL